MSHNPVSSHMRVRSCRARPRHRLLTTYFNHVLMRARYVEHSLEEEILAILCRPHNNSPAFPVAASDQKAYVDRDGSVLPRSILPSFPALRFQIRS